MIFRVTVEKPSEVSESIKNEIQQDTECILEIEKILPVTLA
jgi:hypothetical protein